MAHLPDSPLVIRDGEPRDAEAIADMSRQLAVSTGSPPGLMDAERVANDLIGGRGLSVIVAERDGRTVGYSLYTVAYETAFAARGFYMTDLCVDESARGQGIGKALMRALTERVLADGGCFIWWVVTQENVAAQRFYDTLKGAMAPVQARVVVGDAFNA
ncbi:MAG: GNAT family N-acetyltransferase, partial [Pseudomonadota bacterium]